MVVTEGDPTNPTTLLMKQQPEAAFTSSYDEKKAAMHSSGSYHHMQPRPSALTANRFIKRSRAAPQTLQTYGVI